jgi:hypothetical protein
MRFDKRLRRAPRFSLKQQANRFRRGYLGTGEASAEFSRLLLKGQKSAWARLSRSPRLPRLGGLAGARARRDAAAPPVLDKHMNNWYRNNLWC